MRFISPPQTISEARHREFPVYESGLIAGAAVVVSAVGVGYSIYSSETASADAKAAAKSNAAKQRQQATASAAVARYQAQLNYKTAMAQADVADKNALNLHQQARGTESLGNENINRMVEGQDAQNSSNKAAVGASGITVDSGSPIVVQAYNSGMQQLNRMDALYSTNVAASEKDWAGTMQTYQAAVTRETAKQYQYAEQMASWNEVMGFQSASGQQQQANNVATAQTNAAYGEAISNLGTTVSNAGYAYKEYKANKASDSSQTPNNQSLVSSKPYTGMGSKTYGQQ